MPCSRLGGLCAWRRSEPWLVHGYDVRLVSSRSVEERQLGRLYISAIVLHEQPGRFRPSCCLFSLDRRPRGDLSTLKLWAGDKVLPAHP